ncbi:MAG: GNAT family N-acetyltransferase [Chloroflexi bacterium]|nr:GNAT family N-acetyltransferase [Chloroflexota bacterium]
MPRRTRDDNPGDGSDQEPRDEPGAERLKREQAGSYRTADGRFAVEQAGSGWMVLDAEQADELGLPLARGPFATLDDTRAAITAARQGPAPASELRAKPAHLAAVPDERPRSRSAKRKERARASVKPPRPATTPVIIRELRVSDGPALRALWAEADFRSVGDDDLSLARLVKRNPGLVLVAVEGRRIVASALGAWDGRRGWIYHVAPATSPRRQGIAARLVHQIEDGLRTLGCLKVNVIVRDGNDDGDGFWRELGYEPGSARQFGKELAPD